MLLNEELSAWLDPVNQDIKTLQEFLRPWPDDDIQFHRVSTEVNNARNQGDHLIEPIQDFFP